MKQLMCVLSMALLAVSCANGPDTGDSITVSGVMGTAKKNGMKNHSSISMVTLSGLNFVCTAFNKAATKASSDFANDGSFSVNVPANTAFGCAIVNKTSLKVVASMKIKDTNTGMEDKSSSSLALKQSVDVGSLTLTDGESVIEVPIAKVAAATATVAPKMTASDVHNTAWKMTCVDAADTACTDFVDESPEIFIRIVTATKDSSPILGIGVWATQEDFTACGSIDMTTSDKNDIETDEDGSGAFTWVNNVTAATFSNATSTSSSCPLRENSGSNGTYEDIDNIYTISKLVISGNLFSLNDENVDTSGDPGCNYYHKTAVSFSPENSSVMYGNFETAEAVTDCTTPSNDEELDTASFVVRLTKK
jgi:hypothetical protein